MELNSPLKLMKMPSSMGHYKMSIQKQLPSMRFTQLDFSSEVMKAQGLILQLPYDVNAEVIYFYQHLIECRVKKLHLS
jgi:hypothetical protein